MVSFEENHNGVFMDHHHLSPPIGPDHQVEIPPMIKNSNQLSDSEYVHDKSLSSDIDLPVFVTWSDADAKSLVLGLFIFGKNFIQIKRFLVNKGMGEILSFYYGKFFKTDGYRRWSECRKLKGRKCMIGKKLFSEPRQHELLSRLIPHLSQESQDTLLQVSKSYVDGRISLEEYISSLKCIVGLGVLVDTIGIGNEKGDLTRFDMKHGKNNHCSEEDLEKGSNEDDLSDGHRQCYLKPRSSTYGKDHMKSMIIDTSLVHGRKPFGLRELKYVPDNSVCKVEVDAASKRFKGKKYMRKLKHSNDMSKRIKQNSTKLTVIDTNRLSEGKILKLKVKQLKHPPVEIEDSSMMTTSLLRESKGGSSTVSPKIVDTEMLICDKKKILKTDSSSGASNKNDANKVVKSQKDQHAFLFDDNGMKRIIKNQFNRRVGSGDSNHVAVPIKRRRLSACAKAEKRRINKNSSEKLGFSRSSSYCKANKNVCDPVRHKHNGSTTAFPDRSLQENNEKNILNDSYQRTSVSCAKVEKCESFTLNISQLPSKSENSIMMAKAEGGEQGLKAKEPCLTSATQEVVEEPLRTLCDVGSLEQQADINPWKQSTRYRTLTVRGLECIANEFLHVQKKQKMSKKRPRLEPVTSLDTADMAGDRTASLKKKKKKKDRGVLHQSIPNPELAASGPTPAAEEASLNNFSSIRYTTPANSSMSTHDGDYVVNQVKQTVREGLEVITKAAEIQIDEPTPGNIHSIAIEEMPPTPKVIAFFQGPLRPPVFEDRQECTHSSPNPGSQSKVSDSLDSQTTLHASASATGPQGSGAKQQETPVEHFKRMVNPYDDLDDVSPPSLEAPSDFNFDELFRELKSKMADVDFLGAAYNELVELQGLVSKFNRPDAPTSMSALVLDLEILLDQAVQVITLKTESASRVEERSVVLAQQRDLVSQSKQKIAHWEAKLADKEALATLDADILRWTQQLNWLQHALEEAKRKRAAINTSNLDSLDQKMTEEANLGIEHMNIVRKLEKEVDQLKAKDLLIDRKLERVKIRFDELKQQLKP